MRGVRRRLAAAALGLMAGTAAVLHVPAEPALAATPAARTAAEPRAGVNLAGVTDWTVETPFVDVFRTARDWVSQATTCPGVTAYNCRPNYKWGEGPKLETDANGWVTRLAADQYVDAPIFTRSADAPAWPAGAHEEHYHVTWEGDGDVTIWGGGQILNRGTNWIQYEPGAAGNRFLAITRTNPSNYVRNIHIWMPGYDAVSGAAQVFHPAFLKSLSGMKSLRFMTWMLTNGGSPFKEWTDYPTVARSTQTRGVTPELMAQLANRVGADAWFNMPHQATDDFVRKFAGAVRASLDKNRKAYIEYSNEVWNGTYEYPQSFYAQRKGLDLGLSDVPWIAGMRYQARRSVEIFRIWREVFGAESDSRLVRVLATQSANETVGRTMLEWKDEVIGDRPAYTQADAVAIAPYFHCADRWIPGDPTSYIPYDSKATAVRTQVLAGGVDRLLDACQRSIDGPIRAQIKTYKNLADQYGLSLVAYEGGQHLNALDRDDATLIALFTQANRHQRMRDLYAQYLQLWRDLGGGMFALFLSAETPSRYGASGLREHQDQPLSQAPKARAADQFMQTVGQLPLRVSAPTVTRLSMQSGRATGGAVIRISGANLDAASSIRFGTVTAPFKSVVIKGVTELVATVPAYPGGGAVDVRVVNPAGASAAGATSRFTYHAAPAITAMSRSTALTTGGTVVTLTGTNLTGITKVNVGTLAGEAVRVTPTTVQFTAPRRAVGTVDVTVTGTHGTSAVVPAARLAYVNPPPPAVGTLSATAGPSHAATTVTITGTNLRSATRVTVGKLPASFTVLSDTQIRAVLPAQAGGVVAHVQVVTTVGTSPTHGSTAFRYIAAVVPSVFGVAASGQQYPPRTVTVNGKGFLWTTRVTAAGKSVPFTFVSETQLRVTLPAAAKATSVNIQVVTPAGTSPITANNRYTYP
ncbi:IPT/TIG domain-containing protein [Actinoplanes sp. NPDC051346]|uniref:IPT/TIG domain-containing protein n=1 Tax=Actinoplanes sp. NPDC051346 TaxID=3155048 RepID=UPI00341516F0